MDWVGGIFLHSVFPAGQFTTVVVCHTMRKIMTSQCILGMKYLRVIYSAVRCVLCCNNLIYLKKIDIFKMGDYNLVLWNPG